MKKLLVLLFMGNMFNVFAIVPTSDPYQQGQQQIALTSYLTQASILLSNMITVTNDVDQVNDLQQLLDVQQSITQACASVCDARQQQEIASYIHTTDDNLVRGFAQTLSTLSGTKKTIDDINGIINVFNENTIASSLALQQSALQLQTTQAKTLTDIEALLTQTAQSGAIKSIAEQKAMNDANTGWSKPAHRL